MKWNKRSIAKVIATITIASNLSPLFLLAEPLTPDQAVTITETLDNGEEGEDKKTSNVTVNVHNVNRTVSELDAVKINYFNNSNKLDYRPNIDIKPILGEVDLADIVEEVGTDRENRKQLVLDGDSSSEYAGQVKKLIESNIINRDTHYYYDGETIEVSSNRISSAKGNKPTDTNKPLFYKGSSSISKTDYLTLLMKTDKVLPSKPLIVQTPYKRMNEKLQEVKINSEPIETSPYRKYMGELGIDPNAHDVVVNHKGFRQLNVIFNPDTVESYLSKALSINLISPTEIGGTEGTQFLTENSNDNLKDGWKIPEQPARQAYQEITLSNKHFGDRIVYQKEQYENLLTSNGNVPLGVDCVNPGIVNIWGNSFKYNKTTCGMINPYSKEPTEILKRPSSVQVREGFNSGDKNEKGYQYFKEEEMSLAQAYVLAYKFLKSLGEEPTVTNPEYVNTMFSLNLTNFSAEEREATEYLIALGVVNGDDKELANAPSYQLTNERAVDIVYRVMNKDRRYKHETVLTETDIDMASKGFARANIEITDQAIPTPDIFFRASEPNENGEYETYLDSQIHDRSRNPYLYDMVYIRVPKHVITKVYPAGMGENTPTDGYFRLVTKDNSRVPIEPINYRPLNGGLANLTHDISGVRQGEEIYQPTHVFKSADGYIWQRYFIHKELSNKVEFTAFTSKGTVTLGGINGEGAYYVEEGKTRGNFEKVELKNAHRDTNTQRIYKTLIEFDLDTRTKLQTLNRSTASMEPIELPTRSILWQQTMFLDEVVTPKMTAVYSSITEDRMPIIKYKGVQMFVKNGANWELAPDLPMDEDVRNGYTLSKTPNGTYELTYKGTTQSEIEGYSELSFIDRGVGETPTENTTLGYAKISANGEHIVLVSEDELERFGINRAERSGGQKSDKSLYNTKTGQRAFIDTDLNMTLIGNNITHYKDGHMMVMSVGDKIFYNLAILMELINDTNAVVERTGKNILVGTPMLSSAEEVYELTNVHDIMLGGHRDGKVIDRTYVMTRKPRSNQRSFFMNMSALTSSASNFLYFKNRDGENDFDLLVTYKPNVPDTTLGHRGVGSQSPGATFTENGVINAYNKSKRLDDKKNNSANMTNQSQTDNTSYAKKVVFDKLFKMGSGIGNQVLDGDYILHAYVINNSSINPTEAVKKFLSYVTEQDDGVYQKFLASTEYDKDELGIEEVATSDGEKGLFHLSLLNAGVSINQDADFMTHTPTGNLWYRITKNGASNTIPLQNVVGQRFYYDKVLKKIQLRKKVYYEGTPLKYIPLEIYAKTGSKEFSALEATTDGDVDYNFPNKLHKLSVRGNEDANLIIPIAEQGITDFGLTTRLEVPYRQIDSEFINTVVSNDIQLAQIKIFEDTVKMFQDKIFNSYPARHAMGNMEEGNTVSVGYANDLDNKLAFLTGSWGGLNGKSSAHYVPELCPNLETCGHEKHYTMTVGDDIVGGTYKDDTVKFYLHEIRPGSIRKTEGTYNSNRTYPIKTKADLPKDIKDLLDSEEKLPIYYKPSLAIPAGTTMVDLQGNLIYNPGQHMRGYLNFSNDIINNMLARMDISDLETTSFLGEADIYSAIEIGGRMFIKLNNKQKLDFSGGGDPIQWDRLLVVPKTDSTGNFSTYSTANLNEALLMLNTMELKDVVLPAQNGIAEVSLFDILGPSGFRIPTKGEITGSFKVHNSDVNRLGKKLYLDSIDSAFLIDEYLKSNNGTTKYGADAYKINLTKIRNREGLDAPFTPIGRAGSAIPLMVIYAPPTIQIESKQGLSDQYKTYKAIKYWDMGAFNVDPNDSVINILKSHDTPAETIEGILDSMRKSGLDGTYYTKYAFTEFIKAVTSWIFNVILLTVIPLLLTLVWLFVTLLTVVFSFSKPQEWAQRLNTRFQRDLIGTLSFGVVDVYADETKWGHYMTVSMLLWSVAFFMWQGYLLKMVIHLFIGDGSLITALRKGFREIFLN